MKIVLKCIVILVLMASGKMPDHGAGADPIKWNPLGDAITQDQDPPAEDDEEVDNPS